MTERRTRSGLGTYVTDMKVKRVVDVYRQPTTTVYNLVALNELAKNANSSGTVHSAVRYDGRAASTVGGTDGVPPIYLIGATARQQDIFDRIIENGRSNPEFMANLGRIATHNTDGMWIIVADLSPLVPPAGMLNPYQSAPIVGGIAQGGANDRQFELQVYDMGGTKVAEEIELLIRQREAEQRAGGYSDSQKIRVGTRETTWGQLLNDLRAELRQVHELGDIYFARHVIHEMFHWDANARHVDFSAPSDMSGLTTLLATTPEQVMDRVLNDPTYNPSDRVLENLAASINLNVTVLAQTLAKERQIWAEDRYHDLQVAIFDGYDVLRKADPTADFDFAALRRHQILKLKDGAPLDSENPNDHEPTTAFSRTYENAVATRTTAITARAYFLNALNGQLDGFGVDRGGPIDDVTVVGSGATVAQLDAQLAEIERQIRESRRDLEAIEALGQYGKLGSSLGSTLAGFLGGDKTVNTLVVSPLLAAIGDNLAEVVANGGVTQHLPSGLPRNVLADFGSELFAEVKGAGVGALSTFLVSELVNVLNLKGVVAEGFQTAGTTVVSQVIDNMIRLAGGATDITLFTGVGNLTSLGSAAASFLGGKLADQIATFDNVGGQIGSALGSAFAAWDAGMFLAAAGLNPVTFAVAVAWVAFWKIAGGFIGSLFGGTPRSGADAAWDEATGRFAVANAYSRKGGSKDAAIAVATGVSDTLNAVLDATGGMLEDPLAVQTGNYGMRSKDFVYRPHSTRDKDAITMRWKGKTAAADAAQYGIFTALTDPDFQLVGGDLFAKRAFYNHLKLVGNYKDFAATALFSDLALAADYATYFSNTTAINTLISMSPDSLFTAGWAITLARAEELGLTRRAASDWSGGFTSIFEDSYGIGVGSISFAIQRGQSAERRFVVYDENGDYEGFLGDTIVADHVTHITGTDHADVITLTHHQTTVDGRKVVGGVDWLADSTGFKIDGTLASGAVSIDVAASIDAGAGDDTVHAGDMGNNAFGGEGNDILYGGRLDDWLLGDVGNDIIHAGAVGGGLGGDGNYLDGGAGNDQLYGREGSDWLEGGEGTDILEGGDGDDILAGGGGDGDILKGGRGNDQYIVRRGDGTGDVIDEVATATIVRDTTRGSINWLGDEADLLRAAFRNREAVLNNSAERFTAAVSADGDDAIVFGAGIEMGDLELKRSGTETTPGADLMIKVKSDDGSFSELAVKDWFTDPVKRIEWLKFADGNEIRIGDTVNFIVGTPGNDLIIGTEYADFVVAGDGDDEVHLLGGDDFGSGGTGDDILFGGDQRDIIVGGLGRDTLYGGAHGDMLSGDAGDDEIDGGDGDDTVSGGRGDDRLKGGAGNDVFKYSRGDGRDTIVQEEVISTPDETLWVDMTDGYGRLLGGYSYDRITGELIDSEGMLLREDVDYGGARSLSWRVPLRYNGTTLQRYTGAVSTSAAAAGSDRISFEVGINVQDLVFDTSGPDLVIGIGRENDQGGAAADSADRITIRDWNGPSAPGGRPVKEMVFYQAGTVDIGSNGKVLKGGTAGDDSLVGGAGQDWITGAGGRDTLKGGDSNDILSGGGDDDRLEGEAGADVLYGGAGQDELLGGAGDDVLSGGADNDVLEGGAGSDLLAGGAGEDTASYAGSSFGVTASLDGSAANTGDAAGDEYDSIENLIGSKSGDRLFGDEGDNVLEGGQGNDHLRGQEGDDVYVWSRGDGDDFIAEGFEEVYDSAGALNPYYTESWSRYSQWVSTRDGPYEFPETLPTEEPDGNGYYNHFWSLSIVGAAGETIFSGGPWVNGSEIDPPREAALASNSWFDGFAPTGNGQQVGRGSTDAAASGSDTLEFGEGISLSDLSFEQIGSDLIIRIGGEGGGAIRLRGQYPAPAVETLQFHDGAAVSLKGFIVGRRNGSLMEAVDDLLVGGVTFNNSILMMGGAGNDFMVGNTGLNRLYGEDGDDVLEASIGKDIFLGGAGEDTVRYVGSDGAVNVSLVAGAPMATGGSAETDTFSDIENVTGSAYGDTITGNGFDNKLIGLGGDNVLTGNGGDDVLTALGGNDTLDGGDGDDVLSAGDGSDWLAGGAGNDILDGGAGSDVIMGGAGDDRIMGGEGGGLLDGGDGNDSITGGSGADNISGGDGADIISGQGGGDDLHGGAGDDQYVFGSGTGNDRITDSSGRNAITFTDGIDHSRLWLTREGDQLRIGVIGSDHVVTVQGFFAASAEASRIHSVQAGKHTLFLDGAKGQALIQRMTTANPTALPGAMDALVGADLHLYWSEGNTAPQNIALASAGAIAVAEGTTALTAAGVAPSFVATDAEGDSFVWSMVNDAGGRFGIDAQTGTLSVLDPTRLDFESVQSHDLTIRATDAQGAFTDHSFTIAVTDRNDAPDTPSLEAGSGIVPQGSDSWFARFALQDQDGAPVLQLVDNPGGLFTVVGNEVRFASGVTPDFEDLISLGYTPVDSDGDGLGEISISGTVRGSDGIDVSGEAAVTAVIEDVNESPTDMVLLDKAAEPIAERDRLATDSGPNATSGNRPALVLGKVHVVDGDHPTQKTGQYTYKVFENGSAVASQRFAVVDGELRLLAGKSLDYETDGASIDLRIAATDLTLAPAFSRTFTFAIGDEIDVLGGDEGDNDPLTGQSGQDLILGYGGNDVLVGGAGPDTLDGGAGTDIASYASASGPISADLEAKTVLADGATDTLISIEGVRGSAFADTLNGSSGADVLEGGAGDDLLNGLGGADRMTGGTGNDNYVVNDIGDQVIELAGEGVDSVYTAMASYTLADNVEKLFGMSTVNPQHLKDNALDNIITGTAQADFLYITAGGNDTVHGGEGNDVFVVGGALTGGDRLDGGAGTDTILFQGNTSVVLTAQVAANIENLSFRSGADALYGAIGVYSYNITIADSMVASGAQMRVNAANLVAGSTLTFDGSAETDGSFYIMTSPGLDNLKGGAKDDIFYVYEGGYQLGDRFDGGAGFDQVQFRGNPPITLGATALTGIESILLLSGGATAWTHNLTLNDGNVAAGQTLTVDGSGLTAGEGIAVNGAAEANGKLVLKGGAGNDVLTGGSGSDILTGGLGNDTLTGGLGADQMAGGAGNDLYVVDGAGGSISELANEGIDEVRTSLGVYALAANVENLTSTGTGSFRATGNALDNVVKGSASNDYFYLQDGGSDTVQAGAGNDWIYVGKTLSAGDVFDGGAGTSDQLALQGNYAVTLSAQHLTNIEFLYLMSGTDTFGGDTSNSRYTYNVTTVDANVAAGARLNVDGWYLVAGENFTFNGSAETDGSFLIDGGLGTDSLTGGAGNDILSFEEGRWQTGDKVAGGAGVDILKLKGAYSIVFAADSMSGIETLQLSAGTAVASYPYALTMNDGNVAAGQSLKVDGTALRSTEALTFDGSAETNGTFQLFGGAASDSLKGGAGIDILTGGAGDDVLDGRAGADQMAGGAGNDTYVVDDVLDVVTEAAGEGTADHVQTSLRTYTLGEGLENLTSTVVDGATTYTGNAADNVITTGGSSDRIILFTGGKDIVSTGAGNDVVILLGRQFSADDRFDLGLGTDQLAIRGSLTATFGAGHLAGVESLAILSGLDDRYGIAAAERVLAHYNLTTIDANVGVGATLTADAAQTVSGETVRFDGRAETDGSFLIYGGGGTDTFFGGARDDLFGFTEGIAGTGAFSSGDTVDGGAGTDKLRLRGAYTIAFTSGAMTSIETLELLSGVPRGGIYNYNITMNDGNVAAGALLAVDASGLAATEKLTFVGSAETNGRFQITGGAGNDEVRGGSGVDTISTGAGDDTIHMRAVGEDFVDGGAGTDRISFADHAGKVVVNLATDAKLISIENVTGGSAGDELTGSDAANTLDGGAGNDTLQGGKGADQLIGGDHVVIVNDLQDFGSRGGDTVSYAASGVASQTEVVATGGLGVDDDGNGTIDRQALQTRNLTLNGVRVNLADNVIGSASTATGADAAGDQFSGIENLLGSSSNDLLRGNSTASDVAGGAGEDLIYGGGGDDRLYGGAGDDVLYGQAGKDELYGGDGDDRLFGEEVGDDLYGGAGNDILVGGAGNDVYHFARGDGNDRIFNYDPTGAFDQLSMGDDILFDNLWFERVDKNGVPSDTGIDLRITVLGQSGHDGTVTVDDWFKTGVSPGLFQLDMITDSNDRATVPADIDELIAVMKGKARPATQAAMNLYLTSADFRAGVDGGWQKLTKPVLLDVLDFVTNEPLDGADPKVTFKVRAYYENAPGQNLSIPDEQIELKLVGADGKLPTQYVTHFDGGTIGSDGYRTVTLTLTPNGSTHLLTNGSLPVAITARLRGVADTKGTLTARDDFKLTILQTADTPTLSASSAGGNAGTSIPIALTTFTPDQDGSETVGALIGGVPAGYGLTNAAGAAVGTWQGFDPAGRALALVDAGKTAVTSLGGGTYRIAKTGINQLDASAVSTTAMQGDFILRAKSIVNDSFSVMGMNSDPRTDHAYASIDYGIGWLNGVPGILENGVHTSNFAANGDLWMWRKGTTIYYGTGPDFQTASTTGLIRTATGATQALYFDSAFGTNNNTVEVQVVEAATRVVAADLPGLRLLAPAGRSSDANLTITPESKDGPSTRKGAPYALKVAVNAAPTDIATRGAGTAPVLNISESTATNNPIGKVVGIASAVDPDALDRNLVSTDFSQLARLGRGEEQVVYAAGPDGKVTQILETGQKAGGAAGYGGGVSNAISDALDSSKAYKFSVNVKMDSSFAHSLWFGALSGLENAVTGAAATSGYGAFVEGGASVLQSGRWYRIEGYILPVGHELLAGQDLMGGIFDSATGAKVANANTFRFTPGAQAASIHFYTYGSEQNQGFSTQWHQPQVEKLEYRYELVGTNPLFKINPVTGAIVATSSAIDFESAQSHNVTVRVIDRSTDPAVDPVGLTKDKTVTVSVNNLNEPNSFPATPPAGLGANENVAGAIVGTVQANDIDSSSTPFGQQAYGFWDPVARTFKATSNDNRYVIDADTGQIRTNIALNYETMTAPVSYWVAARDNKGVGSYFQAEMQISIAVRDVNEANSFAAPYSMNVNENLAAGTAVGTVKANDFDLPGTLNAQQRYFFWNGSATVATTADGRYTINQTTGAITTAKMLDRETMTAPTTYRVVALDGGTPTFRAETDVTITVNNVNEAPVVSNAPASRFADEAGVGSSNGAQSGSVFATYALSDPDGTVPALQFVSNPGNWFAIVGNQVRFAFNFDFEWARSNGFSIADYNGDGRLDAYIGTVSVRASDGSLTSATAGTQFYVSDVNERPSALTLQSQTLHSETIPGDVGHQGKTIATFAVSDPDGTVPSIAIVGGNGNGWFTTSGGNLNFAGANFTSDWLRGSLGSHGQDAGWYYDADGDGLKEIRVATLTLAAVDAGGLQGDPFTYNVYIEDKNERPGALTLQSQTLHSEILPGDVGHPGKTIASFGLTDPDGIAPSLSIIGGNGNGWFTTSGGNLNFAGANFTADWFRSGTLGAYGQDSGWYHDSDGDGLKEIRVATLTLAATDSRGLQGDPFTYNVLIEDKNEAPNWNAAAYSFGLNENPGSYAWVGTVAGSDIDGPASELLYGFAGAARYYDAAIGTVTRSQDGRFLINSQNGHVYVNGAQALDYESAQKSFSYSTSIIDRSGGAHALTRAGTLNINLQNTNDSATWFSQVPVDFTVMENTAVGTVVASGVRATDSDGFGITYSIDQSSNPNGAFGINSSGQIYVASAVDHEAAGWQTDAGGKFANLRVLASDGGSPAATTIKINIGNVRKYVYNNGALDYNLYEMRHQSTNMGGGYGYDEPGLYLPSPWGYGQQGWFNEAWTVEKSTGLVLSWMGEYSQWENTTSRPFPHAGSLAPGYVGHGTWPNPYTMYADQEDIMNGLDGIPQGQPFYPIVFDLGGDGFDLVHVTESKVTTDLNKDGIVEGSGWLRASDGFLVLDRNGDGLVLDWNEISFVKDKPGASTDLEGLVAFDSDGDFKLAAGDARFSEFRLWVDANQDGIGQSGELRSLDEAGIVSISLVRENIKPLAGSITVNSVLATAAFERSDGTVGQVGDVALGRLPQAGPRPEPGGPQFRFGESGASTAVPGTAGPELKPEAGAPGELKSEGTVGMDISRAEEPQSAAAGPAGGSEAQQPPVRAAETQAEPVPRAAELAIRSFAGRQARYSLTASGGNLFVTGNKPEGAVDSRVQEVRSGSLLSFSNGIVGLVAPVILDLDGDGVELKRRGKSGARFDMDGNGTRDDTGWISKQDGFLVVDLDGDGRITSPAELSLLGLKPDARSGLDALAALDSDKNGSIDSRDARFGELRLWVDSNGNGITDGGELRSLADRGIASVGLAARAAADSSVKIGRNAMIATSTFTRTDGSIGSVGDAALAFRAGKSAGVGAAALRQVAADAGGAADGAAVDRDWERALGARLQSLRAGLDSRPLLSLPTEGGSVFDRYARDASAAVATETRRRQMDMPEMQTLAEEEGRVPADAAIAPIVPAADDLRLAKMVQGMASFGLRSGEGEWKNRGQAAQNIDFFA